MLEHEFGRYGVRLYELARGIDESEVVPDQPTQPISVEGTLEKDLLLNELKPMIRRLAEKLWSVSRKEARVARTVALKLKTSEFKILTRSHTPTSPPSSCEELTAMALKLREHVGLASRQRYRLVGVGLSNFREPEGTTAQPVVFESKTICQIPMPNLCRSDRRLIESLHRAGTDALERSCQRQYGRCFMLSMLSISSRNSDVSGGNGRRRRIG